MQNGQSVPNGRIGTGEMFSLNGLWKRSAEQPEVGSAYQCRIPEGSPENAVFFLDSILDDTTVYLDGQWLYACSGGQAAGSIGSHWITLPGKTAGRILEVRSAASGEKLLALLNGRCRLGDKSAMLESFWQHNLYAVLFGFFALAVSSLIWGLGFRLRKHYPAFGYREMRELAGFILCAGVWVMTDSHLLQFVTDRVGAVTMVSFISFLIMPVFLLRFLEGQLSPGKLRLLEKAYLINGVICLALHLSRLMSLYRTIITQHVLTLLSMGVVLKEIIWELRRTGKLALKKLLLGFSMLFACGVAALVEFYLNFADGRYPYFYSLGIFLLIVCLVDAGLGKYMEYMAKSARSEAYRQLAYADAMTGLGNRAAYLSDREQMDASPGLTYIVMDVNNLKTVNDQYGHQAGDSLIKAAADCVKRTFGEKNRSYRLGGDEFLVVLEACSREGVERILMDLETSIAVTNRERQIPVQLAWGFAMAETEQVTPEQLFHEADAHMYRRKQHMKGQLVRDGNTAINT